MASALEVGQRIKAEFTDGEYYPATILAFKKGKVKVHYKDYGDEDDRWVRSEGIKTTKKGIKSGEFLSSAAAKGSQADSAKAISVEVGQALQAMYVDGEYYPATVVTVSESKKRGKAPIKVHYKGYGDEEDAWLSLDSVKSKKIKKSAQEKQGDKPAAKSKAKAKAKVKAKPEMDYSGLEKGMRIQAEGGDGKYYAAEVVTVSKSKDKAKAPVKVNFCGYTKDSDEWLGADRLRSKAIQPKATEKAKTEEKEPRPAMELVPILKRIALHAKNEIAKAVVESSASSDPTTMSYKDMLANVEAVSPALALMLSKREVAGKECSSHGLERMSAAKTGPKHIAFLVNPSIAYVVTELSIWAAGATCVPLSVHSPAPELEYFVEDSEAVLLIADKANEAKLKPIAEKLGRMFATISSSEPLKYSISCETDRSSTLPVEQTCMMTSSALILYTSGTTGKPKGVVHTFRSLSAQYASLSKAWKWSSKDYTLHVLPLHHIHGVQNILNCAMYNGAGVEFTPFDAGFCLKRLCSGDMTCFHAVPTIYVKFTQHLEKLDAAGRDEIKKGLRNEKLRYMVSGSAALPVPTMKSWAEISGHVLLERYGMTEIGMALSNMIDGTRFPGCVGWCLPSVRMKVDEEGAILIKGPCCFKEYYKMEEATKKEFTEDGWFKTGDNVQVGGTEEEIAELKVAAKEVIGATGRDLPCDVLNKNKLEKIAKILGRTSVDIIKSGGYKLSALEIESILLQHEKITECAVVGKPDETWGEKVTAVCVLNGDLTIKELRDWGKERMATYKVPQELEAVTELPRNQMGKLEKKKILDRYKQ